MRQAALAMEKAAEPEPHSEGLRFLLSLGHSASVRGQDLLLGLDAEIALDALAHPQREPFPLREDIAGLARALAFELGCEVALRFSPNFPAQVTGNRRLLRLATAATVLTCAEHGPQGAELLIEASHEDLNITDVTVRFAVSATGAPTIGELPLHRSHAADKALPALLGLSQLVELAGGQVDSNGAATQLGYSLPVVRYKRITGSTLYGLGALIDRSVLVVDPRSIGRLTICEQLAAWRLSPTGVAGVAEALTVVERARVDGERLDLVVVSGFLGEQPEIVRQLAEQLALVGQARVISLEDIETLCRPVAADLAEMPALALRRMPRPPSPNELIAVLTELLVPRPVHREVPARGPGLSLLVAEDNVVNQTLMMKMLERRGHSVRVADNGADLVDRLWEAPGEFDAVLMDIQMPVMDGLEATAVIRLREAQSQRPRMPIIAVTAHAMGGERERCLEAGMDGYLAKPIVERELTALLEAIAAQPRPGTGPEAPVRSTTEVFDRRRVLELAAGDMDFLRGLVALFGDDAPRLVSQVADHLAAGDAEAAYRKAHQLKGSIGNFGADRACTAAAELEELARNGEVARAAAKVAPLQREVDTLVSGLRALIREVAS